MAFASRIGPDFGAFQRGLAGLLILGLVLLAGTPGYAATVAVIDEARPVQDITDSLAPVLAPASTDDKGHIAAPKPRTLAFETAFSGWASLTVHNPGANPIERILVFSYPALARSGPAGAALANPRIVDVRSVDGDIPAELKMSRLDNRFGALELRLAPGATRTFAFLFENGDDATAAHVWEPGALTRFDALLLVAVGLFWGILFVGVALMFAMRILSSGQGLFTGGLFALSALAFEAASFDFGGAGWTSTLGSLGFDAIAAARAVALVLVSFSGLEFVRRVLSLRDETPLTDLAVHLVQYALLTAVPLIFWPGIGPGAARVAAAVALLVSGLTVWNTRRSLPDALQLVPPGWSLLTLAGLSALSISGFGISAGGPVTGLLLHGLFVVGIMLLIFSAAVRATMSGGVVEYDGATQVPAYARASPPLPVPVALAAPAGERGDSYQGLWDWNIAEDRLYVSPSVEAMIGLPDGAIKGKERLWAERIIDADRATYADTLQHYMHQGSSSFAVEFRVRHGEGGVRWLQLRATGLPGEDGKAARIIGVVTDISSAKHAEENLLREVTHDPLTGIGNRAYLVSHLEWALATHRDHPLIDPATGTRLAPALILLDIDNFKTVNDELGHAAGDQLLTQIAHRIEQSLGPHDVHARIGGDEFAVLLMPQAGEPPVMEDATAMTALLADLVAQPMALAGETVTPSAAVALVEIAEHHRHAQAVLADAELALKRAKRRDGTPNTLPAVLEPGRESAAKPATPSALISGLKKLESNIKSSLATESAIETDLRNAMQRDQMKVAFQPIMTLADRSLVGFEALLRWQHPQRGLVPPDEFIPIAESTGLIVTLGRFALSMASLQLAQWQTFFPLKRPLFVTVNVSSHQLLGEEFARDVSEVLSSVRLAPGSLKLEVTESLVFEDENHVAKLLEVIKGKGVSIALDDYGQGHSNLNRLKSLPLSTVKIDREFVKGAGDNGRADTILRSTISMAHEMKLDVVAEGVEKEGQAQALMKFGCDFAQGHLFGGAMSPPDAQRFIAMHWKAEPAKAAKKA